MLVFLEIFGHFIAAIAAAVAIAGDTWHPENKGFRKITFTGWAAFIIALLGFLVSFTSTFLQYQDAVERERAAAQEILDSWNVIVSPFRLFLWEIDGEQPSPNAQMLQRILDENMLEKINAEIDIRGEAPHHYGPWLQLICESASNGIRELRQAQTIYIGIVGADLVTKVKDVVQSQALESMRVTTPCGRYEPSTDYFLHLHSIANLDNFKKFISAMLALKKELDSYNVIEKA